MYWRSFQFPEQILSLSLLVLCLVILAGFPLLAAFAQDQKEPVFEGVKLSAWVTQLKDPSAKRRQAAALAIGQIGYGAASAFDPLLAAAKDTDPEVRAEVVSALGLLPPDPKAVPTLVAALKDESRGVRTTAL